MKKPLYFINIAIIIIEICGFSSCEHIPTMPIISYNNETQNIKIIQTDTSAHDTAYISIEELYDIAIPIKDTLNIGILQLSKKFNQLLYAYHLATNNNNLSIVVKTTRTNDTVFVYHYKPIEIRPIPIAKVISGNCLGLYDVNYNRVYKEKIRLWIYKHNIVPDTVLIENMNSLIKQFNYSGYKEYDKVSGNIPILASLDNNKYRVKTDISGKYFYLYACLSENDIKSFVESKISKGLNDAKNSLDGDFTCHHSGTSGINTIFLIAIDDNWKYDIIPVGLVIIDDTAPTIGLLGHRPNNNIGILRNIDKIRNDRNKKNWEIEESRNSSLSSEQLLVTSHNIRIHIPRPNNITSSLYVSYGSFQGNDYSGYNIPFYLDFEGDIKSITIGNHIINPQKTRSGECIRLHIRNLHVGDNSLPISATDFRGNKSTSFLSIPIVSVRSYRNNEEDYDDLENRIYDLENRMDNLE